MAFRPIQYDEGKTVELPFKSGETTTKYCAVVINCSTGYYYTGAINAEDVRYIALEATVTTADGEMVLCLPVKGVRIIADTRVDLVRATHVGTYTDLYTSAVLDIASSNEDVFYIEDICGELTDRQVYGYFCPVRAGQD